MVVFSRLASFIRAGTSNLFKSVTKDKRLLEKSNFTTRCETVLVLDPILLKEEKKKWLLEGLKSLHNENSLDLGLFKKSVEALDINP